MESRTLKVAQSKRIKVRAGLGGTYYDVFNVHFHKSEQGFSLFVDSPYFSDKKGLLTKSVLPANQVTVESLSLEDGGKVTTHAVKYTHWQDGNAHFSQTGKIFTEIRNGSSPLTASAGHIFTVQVQNFGGFRKSEAGPKQNDGQRIDLDVNFNPSTSSIKFAAWWYHKDAIKLAGDTGPVVVLDDGETKKIAYAISPPVDTGFGDYVLLLRAEELDIPSAVTTPSLSLFGGFSPDRDIGKELTFLTYVYPAEDYERLLKSLGSIDYRPPKPIP